jgi:type IX secretion system PorP/SprF family membrane protein
MHLTLASSIYNFRPMNKLCTRLLAVAVLLSCVITSQAQDVRFSQFFNSPMRLNPAMTGVFDGSLRAVVNYRDQWGSLFQTNSMRTYNASVEGKFLGPKDDYFAVGGSLMGDKAGSLGYRQFEAHVSGSYHKILGRPRAWKRGSNFLTFGAQLGFGQRGLDWSAIRTYSQFDGDGYNPGLGTNEPTNALNNRLFPDMNAGILYYSVSGERKSWYAGLAFNHLNSPNISLGRVRSEPLYMRITAHAGAELPLGSASKKSPMSLLPTAMVMTQGPSMEINAGLAMHYRQAKSGDISFRFGSYFRMAKDYVSPAVRPESIIFMAGIGVSDFMLGFSYDVPVSSIRVATQSQGAFEVSAIYINPNKGSKRQGCPTF